MEVSGEGASHYTYKSRVSYGNLFKNGIEMLISASYYDSNGRSRLYYKEFDDPASNITNATLFSGNLRKGF